MHRRARSGGPSRPSSLRWVYRCAAIALVGSLSVTGCVRFDESTDAPFTPAPSLDDGGIEQPVPPPPPTTESSEPAKPPTADTACPDPNPAVIATCLDTLSGIVVLPGAQSALVAERRTGRIMEVFRDGRLPVEFATLAVDGSGDGGLLDLALSPSYAEDGLVYAYTTTAADSRVVRIAAGDTPKPILVGLPRGASNNAGAIEFVSPGELFILTGDAGIPTAGLDPTSQAGKVLGLTDLRVSDQPKAPRVVLSGIGRAGGLCPGTDGSTWVTDDAGGIDRLQRLASDGSMGQPLWTWPDAPGIAGCAGGESSVVVALNGTRALASLGIDSQTGLVGSAPTLNYEGEFGRLYGVSVGADSEVWVTTTNKNDPTPGPTDDRVAILVPDGAAGDALD